MHGIWSDFLGNVPYLLQPRMGQNVTQFSISELHRDDEEL